MDGKWAYGEEFRIHRCSDFNISLKITNKTLKVFFHSADIRGKKVGPHTTKANPSRGGDAKPGVSGKETAQPPKLFERSSLDWAFPMGSPGRAKYMFNCFGEAQGDWTFLMPALFGTGM
jgi:hypothetical protein